MECVVHLLVGVADQLNRVFLHRFPEIIIEHNNKNILTYFRENLDKQGNSVTRDLPRTGSETNTTIFVIYIYWI